MMTTQRTTRDLKPVIATALLPDRCVDANALRTLATKLDQLATFRNSRRGPGESPCLREVGVRDGRVYARIDDGHRTYKLELLRGSWTFV